MSSSDELFRESIDKVVFLCGRDDFKFLVEAEGKLDVVRQER